MDIGQSNIVELVANAVRTSTVTGTGVDIRAYGGTGQVVLQSSAATAGTSPTLDVKIQESADNVLAVAQVETFDTVADSSDSLDGTYFLLYDEDGSVAVWIDTDDSGTTIPTGASAADRALEVTTIATDAIDSTVATAVAAVINADSKFASTATNETVTVTHATAGAVSVGADGDAGFITFAATTAGTDLSYSDISGATFSQVTDGADASEMVALNITDAKRYVRVIGTIGGTSTPTFGFGVSLVAVRESGRNASQDV